MRIASIVEEKTQDLSLMGEKRAGEMAHTLKGLICKNAPARPSPGGKLHNQAMWHVDIHKHTHDQLILEIKATRSDSSMEKTLPEPKRYAWSVEFGHNVKKAKLPFLRENGYLWRVTHSPDGVWYRWKPTRVNSPKDTKRIPSAQAKKDIVWLKTGKRTSHVAGKHFVRDSVHEFFTRYKGWGKRGIRRGDEIRKYEISTTGIDARNMYSRKIENQYISLKFRGV